MESPAKPRILVVEDDLIGALALQNDLQELGYEVPLVAGSNEDVAALVERWQPAVLVAALPEEGSVLKGRLAQIGEARPLVLIAGGAAAADLAARGRFGTAAMLIRPYTQPQLQGIMEMAYARHRLNETLGRVRAWFMRGLEAADEGLLMLDPGSHLLMLNPAGRALTGLSDIDIAGRSLDEMFLLMDEQTGAPVLDVVDDVVRNNRIRRLPPAARLVHRKTRTSFVARVIAPVSGAEDAVVGAVLSFHKPGEAPAPVSQDAERVRLLSLGGLLGAVAHDFNNALGVLAAHPELLKFYARGPGEFFAPLESIQTSIQQAYLLTGQAMAIGRLGATSFGEVDLRKTTNNLLQFSRLANGSELEVDIPPGLWKVRGDEVQIIQAIHNLLVRGRDNLKVKGQLLIRFNNLPAGSHELPSSFRPSTPNQAFVRMVVADSGDPIPKEDTARLFEPEVARRYGPSGIGLIATKTIIDNHAGWMEAHSEAGIGNVIAVYWPALTDRISTPERFEGRPPIGARAPGATVPAPNITNFPAYNRTMPPAGVTQFAAPPPAVRAAASTTAGLAGQPAGSGLRVLIVDDEELVRSSVSGMLKVLGFNCDTAWDGAEGIQKFIRARDMGQPFTLVMLDLIIPLGMGAENAVRELHKLDPSLRIIVTSGYTDHPVIGSYKNYGFRAFLKKPFGLREIKAALAACDLVTPPG